MKVWVQQIAFVDYRQGIFGRIAQSLGTLNVRFFGGDTARDQGLNILSGIEADSGVTVPVTRLRNFFFRKGWCWQGGIVLRSIVGNYQVIVLQGDLTILSNWLVQLVALLRRKRVLLWTHGVYGNEGRVKMCVRLAYLKLSSGLLLYGNYSRELLEGRGFNTEKLYVIYNSSVSLCGGGGYVQDPDSAEVIEGLFEGGLPKWTLVFIGRLTEVKRLDLLLASFGQLRSHGYDVGLLVIGDGPMAGELAVQAEELGVSEAICFYGACYDPVAVARLLSAADLCISPGNVGLTAMSALESGVPVISHNNFKMQMPEFEAIAPRRTGDFFQEGDLEDLTHVITQWLDGDMDPLAVADACKKVISELYNPESQLLTLKGAVEGSPASRFPRRSIIQR